MFPHLLSHVGDLVLPFSPPDYIPFSAVLRPWWGWGATRRRVAEEQGNRGSQFIHLVLVRCGARSREDGTAEAYSYECIILLHSLLLRGDILLELLTKLEANQSLRWLFSPSAATATLQDFFSGGCLVGSHRHPPYRIHSDAMGELHDYNGDWKKGTKDGSVSRLLEFKCQD